MAAIKVSLVGEAKLSVDDSVLLSQFLKNAQRLVPHSRRPASPTWDLGRVMSALEQGPFEPLESVSLQWMLLKVSFLLAITSAKRVGELQGLSVHESCCRFLPGNTGVVLRHSGEQISCSSASGPSAWVNQCRRLGCLIGLWRQSNSHTEKQVNRCQWG